MPPRRPLLLVTGKVDTDLADALARTFIVGDGRTFEADPRFGLIVLSEIGQKALSAGSTTPDGHSRHRHAGAGAGRAPQRHRRNDPSAHQGAPLDARDMIADAFRPLARDGAGNIEVLLRLLVGLRTLSRCRPDLMLAARAMMDDATERGLGA